MHLIWHSRRGRRDNHLWQIFGWSVEGCRFCGGRSKIALSHWQSQWPLTQGWRYRVACDYLPHSYHRLHQKNCHRWLRWRPLRLCQIRCVSVHGGFLGTWVKYNQNYFYLYPFFEELTYRSDPSTDFHAWWLKRCGLTQRCAFLGIFDIAPHLGRSKNPNFGAWIGVFKPNLRNRKACILSKILHRFQPNLAQW